MGEESAGIATLEEESEGIDTQTPTQEVAALRTEIEDIREDLGTYISELDRRRHEATDVKVQVRKHTGLVIGIAIALIAFVTASVTLKVRARRPRTLMARLRRRARI